MSNSRIMSKDTVHLIVKRTLWTSKDADARTTMTVNFADIVQRKPTVRTTFTIEIKADLPAHDEKRRNTFIKLMLQYTRTLLAQSAMLAGQMSPEFSLSMEDRNGIQELDLFDETPSTIDSGEK